MNGKVKLSLLKIQIIIILILASSEVFQLIPEMQYKAIIQAVYSPKFHNLLMSLF